MCWGADISNPEKNYKRGWDCITSNHGRTLEFVNVEMILDGYSARVIREWYTHIGGAPTRLQASTRYIDYGEFDYIVPPSIEKDKDLYGTYISTMGTISAAIAELEEYGIPREDAAMLLPLGMTTRIVDKRNLRNLIDMSRQRLCYKAYWEFQELFRDIMAELTKVSEEWEQIVSLTMHPKCYALGGCTEKHNCGIVPKKGEKYGNENQT